jgi:hypothetical protein
VRRRLIRWFRHTRLLDAAAAADMLAWENSGFSVDASVRIALIDRDVPSYFRSLEHLLRYCARPPFALERLSVIRGADGQIARIRYVLPRHKAANWVGPRPQVHAAGSHGVVELTPFEFLDRLADLVPPPRKHRHRYHGVFAPNSPAQARRHGTRDRQHRQAARGRANGLARDGNGTGGCCDAAHAHQKPRSHDTSRIAWAKLMARVGEEFPLECPNCGGDIRLIAFITEPGPIRKILTHLGEPLEPPPVSPARGPPTEWGELVQMHDDRAMSFKRRPTSCPRSTSTASERCRTRGIEGPGTVTRDDGLRRGEKNAIAAVRERCFAYRETRFQTPRPLLPEAHESLISPEDRCGSAIDRAILSCDSQTEREPRQDGGLEDLQRACRPFPACPLPPKRPIF